MDEYKKIADDFLQKNNVSIAFSQMIVDFFKFIIEDKHLFLITDQEIEEFAKKKSIELNSKYFLNKEIDASEKAIIIGAKWVRDKINQKNA